MAAFLNALFLIWKKNEVTVEFSRKIPSDVYEEHDIFKVSCLCDTSLAGRVILASFLAFAVVRFSVYPELDPCHFFALMGRCLGAVWVFLTITRATFFFFLIGILVVGRPSLSSRRARPLQRTENTGATAPPKQEVEAIRQHGDLYCLHGDPGGLSAVTDLPRCPQQARRRVPPCPDAPPDQRLTAHPGPPAPVSGRGEWDYLHLQIHPWRPRFLAPALPPLPPLQQHPFRGAIGHHAPPHLSGVIGGEEVRRRSRGYLRGQGETVEFILDVHPDYRGLGITGLA